MILVKKQDMMRQSTQITKHFIVDLHVKYQSQKWRSCMDTEWESVQKCMILRETH